MIRSVSSLSLGRKSLCLVIAYYGQGPHSSSSMQFREGQKLLLSPWLTLPLAQNGAHPTEAQLGVTCSGSPQHLKCQGRPQTQPLPLVDSVMALWRSSACILCSGQALARKSAVSLARLPSSRAAVVSGPSGTVPTMPRLTLNVDRMEADTKAVSMSLTGTGMFSSARSVSHGDGGSILPPGLRGKCHLPHTELPSVRHHE